ncbi:hypothetical protein AB5J56_00690 [Streptomyces sp. R21]|uniref:Uncharacterized protein n=1 Tax=Streptomyces sp. R21 TaxID=3238627 RepID=A0AB39P2B8_9ACTN
MKKQRFSNGSQESQSSSVESRRGKEEMSRDLSSANDQLSAVQFYLNKSKLVPEKGPDSEYGKLFWGLYQDCQKEGIKAKDFCSAFLYGKDYPRRVRDGVAGVLSHDDLFIGLASLEKGTGFKEKIAFTPERQEELEKARAKEERERKEAIKGRLESAETKLKRKIELDAALAVCIGALRTKIGSLSQELAVPGGQQQSLRRRLELAEEALRRALARREKNHEELRECAGRLLKVVGEVKPFLDL